MGLSATDRDFVGAHPSRRRWGMINCVLVATIIDYLDRQTLSVVTPALREQFKMSNEAYGFVLSAFMLAYTVSNGASALLLDCWHPARRVSCCSSWDGCGCCRNFNAKT